MLCDALAGLHAAHDLKDEEGRALDVVHRDVSPQNILVGTDGMARLADFGIARAASRLSQTEPGSVKGKVAYMPPEQIQGGPLDRRCDVWAAGVIAWELVANRRLFEQHDQLAVAMQLLSDPIPGIHAVNPDVPHALAVAIGQALEKDRAARTPTAAAFRSALLEACKSSGVTLLDHEEVGAIVERLTRASLDERHKKAKAILAARRDQGGERVSDPQPSSPQATTPAATPSIPGESTSISPTQQTDTSSARDQHPKQRQERRLALAAAGTLLAVGAVATLLMWSSNRAGSSPDGPELVAAKAAPSEVKSLGGSSSPVTVSSPSITPSSAAPVASLLPSATSSAVASGAKAGPPPPSAKRPIKAPPPSPLATNPYGAKP